MDAQPEIAPRCPYCGETARLVDSSRVYGGRSYGLVWICRNYPDCDAYVGVHKGTRRPKGTLANAETRQARMRAHEAFDPLWQGAASHYQIAERGSARKRAIRNIVMMARIRCYRWLAAELGVDEVHIAESDTDTCAKIVRACSHASYPQIRDWAKAHNREKHR